jgi:hypothetical protein
MQKIYKRNVRLFLKIDGKPLSSLRSNLMHHRIHLFKVFQGNVAKDSVPFCFPPGWNILFTDFAAIWQHLMPPGTAGVETTAAGRSEGAGYGATLANIFLFRFGVGNRNRSQ